MPFASALHRHMLPAQRLVGEAVVRTSNDAADLSQQDARKAIDALLRGDCPDAIQIEQESAFRNQLRAMALMRAPSVMH